MSDLEVSGKSPIYDANIQPVGSLPAKPTANGQDEVYFTLGDDLFVAQGRALSGIQNLKIGDWVSLDGQTGEIVRIDIETTDPDRLFNHTLDTAILQVKTTPTNAECDDYFMEALVLSQSWQQALEVGAGAAKGPLGPMGAMAAEAFATATERCLTAQDCLQVAKTAAAADETFFRWSVRAAVRQALKTAQSPADFQAIAEAARHYRFPLLASKAERQAANPPR